MLSKEQVKILLEKMLKDDNTLNDNNRELINKYLYKIDSFSDTEWNIFIEENNITEENFYDYLKSKLASLSKFIPLNDLISYGVSGNTLHIHIIPTDVRSMITGKGPSIAYEKLISALKEIQKLLTTKPEMENISSVFAVSPILKMKHLQTMFKTLDFEVSKTTNAYFLNIFPNKQVWQAELSKEKLLSKEWNEKTTKIRNLLSKNSNEYR